MKKNTIISIVLICLVLIFALGSAKVSAVQEPLAVSLHVGSEKTLSFSYDGDLSLSYDEGTVRANMSSVGNEYKLELTGTAAGTTSLSLIDGGEEKLLINIEVEESHFEAKPQKLILAVGQVKEFILDKNNGVVCSNSGNAIMHSAERTDEGTLVKIVAANEGDDFFLVSDFSGNVLMQLEVTVTENDEFSSKEFIMATGEDITVQVTSSSYLKAFSAASAEGVSEVEIEEKDGVKMLHVTALKKGATRVLFKDVSDNVRVELYFYSFDIRGNVEAYVGQTVSFNADPANEDSFTADSDNVTISEKENGTYTIQANQPGEYKLTYRCGDAYGIYQLRCYQLIEMMAHSPASFEFSYNGECSLVGEDNTSFEASMTSDENGNHTVTIEANEKASTTYKVVNANGEELFEIRAYSSAEIRELKVHVGGKYVLPELEDKRLTCSEADFVQINSNGEFIFEKEGSAFIGVYDGDELLYAIALEVTAE